MNAGSIDAILTLNATSFNTGIDSATGKVDKFKASIESFTKEGRAFGIVFGDVLKSIERAVPRITQLNEELGRLKNLDTLSSALKRVADAVKILGDNSLNLEKGMTAVNTIMKSFHDVLGSVEINVKNIVTDFSKLKNEETQLTKVTEQYALGLTNVVKATEQYAVGQTNVQQSIRSSISAYNSQYMAMEKVNEATLVAREGIALYQQNLRALALGVEQFNAIETGHTYKEREVASATNQATQSMQREASASNQVTQSMQRQASASKSATASTNAQTNATNRLSKAMSSLRMIGTMVASMMVWNFASSLVNATRETVNAKSEMEGYFKMLHFNQNEITQFNNALDQTVSKFQRINKYALGETISSIGVEFNLTTKEMEKAMPVVSMITSEYLRAGRNVNEASLAVKDILQGEFQRLSRETGVKGDQLKEAGWSGDKKDVMGLLDALDKVGKSRNWNVFVTKANSLNDAILILQNRFSEWTADMVNVVQPSILFVFNSLLTVGQVFGQAMSGVWEWLHDDGFVNQAVRWTGIATAIGLVTTALISYRTGANLVQMVQMGLRGSITATVLGLKAEEVATYGTRNAIVSKLTSIKAEQVAEMGVRNAILSKVLGLEAEMVANNGLKGAIMSTTFAREIEEAQMMGASAVERGMIALRQQEQLENMNTVSTIIAHVTGVNMQTFAQKGLIVALAERIAQSPIYIGSLKAEEIAELSTAEAGLVLAGTLAPLIAIFVGLAVAVYSVVKPLQDASEQMKSFNNLVNDGQNIIKEHKRTLDNYKASEKGLQEQLDKTAEGTKEHLRLSKQLSELRNGDLKTANENYVNSVKAVEMAVSSKNKFEKRATEIAIEGQTRLADAYIKAGFSATESYEMASSELREAKEGAEQLRKALQMLKYESDRSSKKQEDTIAMLKNKGLDKDTIKKYGNNLANASDHISRGLERFMTSDDLMDRIGGWVEIQQGRLEEWWTELNAFFEVRDWDGIRDKLVEGFNYLFYWTPIGQMIDNFGKQIEEKGFVGMIMDALFGEGDTDGFVDVVGQFLNDVVFTPIGEWVAWFIENPSEHLGDIIYGFQTALAHFLFGSDVTVEDVQTMIAEWFDTSIVQPLKDYIANFDFVKWFDETQGGIGGFSALWKLLFGDDATISGVMSEKVTWIIGELSTILQQQIMNIPIIGTFLQLFALLTGENTGANSKGMDLGSNFETSLITVLRSIPIFNTIINLLSLIDPAFATAHGKGEGVGRNTKEGYFSGTDGMVSKAIAEFDRIANEISEKAKDLYSSAHKAGLGILNGLQDALDMHSPSIISRELIPAEFGDYIPQAISDSEETVYGVAQSYARAMYDGMNSLHSDFTLGEVVSDYENDAQVVADYSQIMGLETTTAFDNMNLAVNRTTTQMQGNVVSSYTTMQNKQSQMLNQMKSSNTTAYNEMYTKSNHSLIQMRDSTSNVTQQMVGAWNVMKDSIIASARQISSDATVHFNQLSNTIGSFYRKIQNPSLWGSAGSPTISRGTVNPRAGRTLASMTGFAGGSGVGSYTGTPRMSVSSLKLKLCPNGDCDNIFDGYSGTEMVDVQEFLESIMGEHGFGGWNFSQSHFSYIKNRTNEWDMKSPVINLVGGIPTNTNFKVREFADGNTPHISFGKFQDIAGAIFSRIPYRLYFDSSWKGSWLGALQAGACNCFDGASALLALASTFGYKGYMAHGDWNGIGHVWAVINGVPMDTTAWQGGYGWTSPKVHGYGSPHIHKSDDDGGVNLNGDLIININANGDDVEVDNISEESARQILEVLGVSLATGR